MTACIEPHPANVTFAPAFVVPTLDEEQALPRLLRSVSDAVGRYVAPDGPNRGQQPSPTLARVFVADGGSTDSTRRLAAESGAVVLSTPAGRGLQIRAGVAAAWEAGATVAVIAHADTWVPEDLLRHLETAVRAGAVGGGCLLRFEPATGVLRLGAPLVNWRTRCFKVPLGDQLQWVTRPAWEQIGGIEPWPILEDLDLIRRLRRVGQLAILPCAATTDSRRFLRRGPVRTVATNWLIWTLFALGVAPERLRALYRNIR